MTLCDDKAKAYTMGSDDRLNNFKVIAATMKRTPREVLQVYMAKHWLAIQAYINDGIECRAGIRESIWDVQNYLDLLLAMIEEDSNPPPKE
jgi:hypothetical protein